MTHEAQERKTKSIARTHEIQRLQRACGLCLGEGKGSKAAGKWLQGRGRSPQCVKCKQVIIASLLRL